VPTPTVSLGRRIKELRTRHRFSQQQLADRLGVPRPAISQIEHGSRSVTAEELQTLSKIFSISADALLDLRTEPAVVLAQEHSSGSLKRKTELRISVPQKNVEKFREVLLYLLERVGSRPNIGETVLYKLLYFIDFDYYEKYEEQLMGAVYQKNHYGPTPMAFKKIVDTMIARGEIERVKSEYYTHPQTKYLPRRSADLSKLNARELSMIDEVLDRLGNLNATQISDYSHGDIPWMTTEEGQLIDYESVFYRVAPYSVRGDESDVP